MNGKWSPGKITALVIGGIAAGMFLLAAFYISVAQLMTGVRFLKLAENRASESVRQDRSGEEYSDRYGDGGGTDSAGGGSSSADRAPSGNKSFSGEDSENFSEEEQEDDEFYDFHNAVREGLSYQIRFEDYADMFGSENVLLSMNYPVVSGGEAEDMRGVNRAIQKELEEVKVYMAAKAEEIEPEEDISFYFEGESYVTYMDEEILSVVYVEYGYLDGEFYESYVVCVNVDMESKMALTNTQILNIDDNFSVDFRNRSERQNGEISYLYNFTDQEITDLLTDDESLIIFYTPLGMEVGFNYYYGNGWATVTYKDYEKYLRQF